MFQTFIETIGLAIQWRQVFGLNVR